MGGLPILLFLHHLASESRDITRGRIGMLAWTSPITWSEGNINETIIVRIVPAEFFSIINKITARQFWDFALTATWGEISITFSPSFVIAFTL